MPFHLPPISRRRFLQSSIAAGAAFATAEHVSAASGSEKTETWALLADTHIAADPRTKRSNVNMAGHLEQVVSEVVGRRETLGGALIDGDCAFVEGAAGDYATLLELLRPARAAGLSVHLMLGNHDHRERFWEAVPGSKTSERPVESRHAGVVEGPVANFFLLDSLMETNVTPGKLGEVQIAWLGRELDARSEKPAIVFGHHHPVRQAQGTGLVDSAALFELLVSRRQVKAYVYGHTHHWRVARWEDIHLVNLPPVAYPFIGRDPSGWVEMNLRPEGATLVLNSIDRGHRAHGERVALDWRGS